MKLNIKYLAKLCCRRRVQILAAALANLAYGFRSGSTCDSAGMSTEKGRSQFIRIERKTRRYRCDLLRVSATLPDQRGAPTNLV
jgi:hypothetical protein